MGASSKADPVSILESLVAFRTDVHEGDERVLADHLAELLQRRAPDEVVVSNVSRPGGKAASYVYARFGQPRLLVNAHLDTVPPNADWSSDPFVPRIDGDRLYALGAADTKGAAAAILSALDYVRPQDTAILFSGDEEFSSVVMKDFVAGERRRGIERAIVCEPTNLRAGVRHRGFVAVEVTLGGPGGHSSQADTLPAPLAELARVAVALDDWGRSKRAVGPEGFQGMCMNIAKLDGGIAFNVIPAQGRLLLSVRPPPQDASSVAADMKELEGIVKTVAPAATMEVIRGNVPFATRDVASFEPYLGDIAKAPIDLGFWTEAALLAASGIDAVVFGPGDITQAHGPDEWVAIPELLRARDIFRQAFAATKS